MVKLIVGNSIYECGIAEAMKIVTISSKLLPVGIYVVKKRNIIEMKNESFSSIQELDEAISEYKKQGFKVFCNRELRK